MGVWGQVWVLLAHPVTSFHGDGAVGSGLGMQMVPQQGGRWGQMSSAQEGAGDAQGSAGPCRQRASARSEAQSVACSAMRAAE